MGNRFSSLPIAQFCPHAPRHSAQAGGGRAAIVGRAFHARCSGAPDADTVWRQLTDEEQVEVLRWKAPTVCKLENGVELHYADAKKEVPLGLASGCVYVPKGHPDAITQGTCDLYWVVEQDGWRVAYVPDIKRSEYTVSDGPDSLQIVGYALAVAALEECDGFVCGIWAAVEGTWTWGDLLLWERDSERMFELWKRVEAAALHTEGDYAVGPHCQSCYGRRHCPAWLMPPELAETSLAPFTKEGHPVTNEELCQLVIKAKAAADTAEAVLEFCKAHVRDNGPAVDPISGKLWKPILTKGRSSLDTAAIERDHPGLLERYAKPGKPTDSFRWVKPPKAEKAPEEPEGEAAQ